MGQVYLIRAGTSNLYKVGYTSKTPEDRRSSLQTGNPFPLTVITSWCGSERDEQRLHDLLDPYRKEGEWFELTVAGLVHLLCQYDALSDKPMNSQDVKSFPADEPSSTAENIACSEHCQQLLEFDVLKGDPFVWSEKDKIFWKLPFEKDESYHGVNCFDFCLKRGYIEESSDPPGIFRVNPKIGQEGFEFLWELSFD